MIRRPPRSTLSSSSAASDVYKRQGINAEYGAQIFGMASPRLADFNVAAKSLVDLSHLQETVVWVVNQIHRHQDEIAALQARHDTDFPRLALQNMKLRHFVVNKRYEKYVRETSADGFEAFRREWLIAKDERAKWKKSCRHQRKVDQHKVMRLWEEDWQYNKKCRHLVKFSLRSMAHNRKDVGFGIWFWVWQYRKRHRTVIRNMNDRRNEVHKLKGIAGFFNQWKRKKRHRFIVAKARETADARTCSKIVDAWKFYIDFKRVRATKLAYKLFRRARSTKFNVFNAWADFIETGKRHRGLVKRTTTYRHNRKLERAMEDWDFFVQYSKKQRLLQVDEDDVIERLATMEGRIDGIVRKDRVRPMELEVAAKLIKNLADLKLNTAVKEVQDALARKVDKPTEEQVARRTVRMWKTGIADKQNDQSAVELGKFQSALTAKKEQRAIEDFDARAAEEHAASLLKQRKTVGEQAPTTGSVGAHLAGAQPSQLSSKINDTAKDLAEAVATPGGSDAPVAPHQALLEKQFRRELQDSAGRMVSGIASSIKRRMGEEGSSPSKAGVLSPAAARDMAVRDALAADREVGEAFRDMRAAEDRAAAMGHPLALEAGMPHRGGVIPGLPPRLSAAEMDMALRDARHGDIDRAAYDAAVRGDHMDRRLTEQLRIEDEVRRSPGHPAGLARARAEVERLSSELSREAVTGVETYLRGPN
eukprot:TRINITY_DN5164_c0_g1_i2.p1 TRINITY_DN5164_c0_g1~~TRINITY_DN5164_c0_g1_i2.p1  ORF type:complete len:704 (+),score=201.17 TRINITY_DN5164_c0_g1_i2:93-2204(+)